MLVTENVDRYFQVLSSEEKYEISNEIVDLILYSWGGRFLKRGNHCWVPIDPLEARKKVAQALQYQRRKNTKQDFYLDGKGNALTYSDLGTAPSPPELYRHEQFIPSVSNFPESANIEMRCKKYQQLPVELVRSCALTLAKCKDDSKIDKEASSLHNSSIVQASAIANIANCGKPTYSTKFNSLQHLIAKNRQKVRKSSIDNCNTSAAGIPPEKAQQPLETDLTYYPSLSCAAYSSLLVDSSGEFSLPDMDMNLNSDYFE